MIQPNLYRFYLRYFDGADWYYYELLSNGTVFESLTPTELQKAPIGWKEIEVGWMRGFTYYGMFTNYSTPLKFAFDSAHIIRHLLVTQGIEAKCELLVEKFNSSTSVWDYETLVRSDLDFSTAVSEFDYVTVALIDGGFASKLKARENTPYEYQLDGNSDAQYVEHHGLDLQSKLKWTIVDNVETRDFGSGIYPRLTYYDYEGTNITFTPFDVAPPTTAHHIRNRSGVSVDVENHYYQKVTVTTPNTNTNNGYLYLHRSIFNTNSSGVVTSLASSADILFVGIQFVNQTVNWTIDYQDNFTIASNQIVEYSLQMYLSGGGSSGIDDWEVDFTTGYLNCYFVNTYEKTYTPSLYVRHLFEYLMTSIGSDNLGVPDSTLVIESDFLNSGEYADQIVITSGDGLRNLVGSTLKITFADFFKFLHDKFGCCLKYDKINNTIKLELKEESFVQAVHPTMSVIESVSNLTFKPFTTELFNNLKIGSGTFNYDQKTADATEVTNGKDEFNNTSEFLSPIVRMQRTTDYVSPIRCDMYGIEFVRVNLSGKELADSSSDNDLFAMHINVDDSATYTNPETLVTINYHTLFRDTISTGTWEVQNIFSPETAYNILFSPKRSLFRNGNYLRSLLYFNDADYLNFQISGKNNASNLKMITLSGGVIDYNEGSAEQISDLCANDNLLFQPLIFNFEAKEEINLYSMIETAPYNYIGFKYLGNTYYGYIIECKSKPSERGSASFTLLSATEATGTDLTNLVR